MKLLFAASECLPFIKTGGLADVAGTLPRAVAGLCPQDEVRVILPKYKKIPEKYRFIMRHLFDTHINLGWRSQYLGVDELTVDGVTYWFVDNEYYFGGDYVYGWGDHETERFCFFCKAVLESLPRLGFMPDVIHCNDWQTGYLPLLAKQYSRRPGYGSIRTVFTIHNLRFQGIGRRALVEDLLSLSSGELDSIEYSGGVSAMKAAIRYADRLTTVSPTYAKEIMTPEFGETLDLDLRLRAQDLCGILNGISNDLYDPANDPAVAAHFDAQHPEGKREAKRALLEELGLDGDVDRPLVAVISRLTDQKGIDLIARLVPELISRSARVVILGMGEERYEQLFARMYCESRAFAFRCEMNDALSRRIYAGADIFLMPSAFEPCGLSQILAMRYGCIPVVRETGGLYDTVTPYNRFEGTGRGFTYCGRSYESFRAVANMALDLYYSDKPAWAALVRRAMEADFDWRVSAGKYRELYASLL
ncbi:MAG: glycogen synthase [Clostridia bacterium]|nr:glycogen synthase [Clostridia bacterium]